VKAIEKARLEQQAMAWTWKIINESCEYILAFDTPEQSAYFFKCLHRYVEIIINGRKNPGRGK